MKNDQETIIVEAGEKIEIFKRRFSSVPMCYEFAAKPTGADSLSGWLEIHRQQVVFKSRETIDLNANNSVHASLWDTFVTIYVIAGCDMELTLSERDYKPLKGVFVLLTLLLLMTVALIGLRL